MMSPSQTVSSYLALFTLTRYTSTTSGFVSVALSLGFPLVAVSNCLSLRCPDFPLELAPKRLADNLAPLYYTTYDKTMRELRAQRHRALRSLLCRRPC